REVEDPKDARARRRPGFEPREDLGLVVRLERVGAWPAWPLEIDDGIEALEGRPDGRKVDVGGDHLAVDSLASSDVHDGIGELGHERKSEKEHARTRRDAQVVEEQRPSAVSSVL